MREKENSEKNTQEMNEEEEVNETVNKIMNRTKKYFLYIKKIIRKLKQKDFKTNAFLMTK